MDQDLVVRAQHGEQRAFEVLAAADYPRLFRLAFGILRDRASAEDACQDALVRIWGNLQRLRDPARFEAWSYRLLVNACHDHARRRPRWLPESAIVGDAEPVEGDSTQRLVERDELERALGRLSVEHRTELAFRYLLDMTADEIADTLEIPRKPSTHAWRGRPSRCARRLKPMLAPRAAGSPHRRRCDERRTPRRGPARLLLPDRHSASRRATERRGSHGSRGEDATAPPLVAAAGPHAHDDH